MSANEQKPTIQDDEIDLKELFATLKKQKNIIFGVMFASLVAALCYLALAKQVYTQTLLIRVPQINTNTNTNTIATTSHTLLTYLSKPENQSKDQMFDLVTKAPANVLEVTIKAHSPEVLVEEQKQLIDFLAFHPQIKPLIEDNKKITQSMISQIEDQITQNRKIKDHIDEQILSGKNPAIGFNPIEMENAMLQLLEKKLSLSQSLQNIGKFEVINNPVLPTKPSSPKTMLIIVVSLVTGLLLGIFGAFGREFFSTKTEK